MVIFGYKNHVGPILISTDENAVSYNASIGIRYSMHTFEYYGTVYYMSLLSCGWTYPATVEDSRFKAINSPESAFFWENEEVSEEVNELYDIIAKYFLDLYFQ